MCPLRSWASARGIVVAQNAEESTVCSVCVRRGERVGVTEEEA